ncbi:hypothetical protein [Deinococcus sp.]|uniref:hypothetical protein n=1 Tax=Deinococcus sp. TaxID=47478 RepID=UPI003C79FD33
MNSRDVNPEDNRQDEARVADDGHVMAELIEALSRGEALAPQVRAHLAECRECREDWETLRQLQHLLLDEAASMPVAPPPALRAELLSRARDVNQPTDTNRPAASIQTRAAQPVPVEPVPVETVPATRPLSPGHRAALFPRLALGAAALVAALTLGSLLISPPGLAHALPDPAVVVNAGGPLLVASNSRSPDAAGRVAHPARLTLITGERVSATLDVAAPNPAWFTEGVRLGEQVYLADAGNDRVLEVQTRPLRLLNSFPVTGGVAGLSAGQGRVYFKSVTGEVGVLPSADEAGRSVSLAQGDEARAVPIEGVMDAVLLQEGTLYVTHHLRGELCLLDPATLAVRRRIRLGGAPVALAAVRGGLLVLDVHGRLLRLDLAGRLRMAWKLPGQPDKLVLNGEQAVVTDRAGEVTQLDLNSGAQKHLTLYHPMDVALMEGGLVAVAQGQTGVALLGADLKPMPGGEIR